MTFGFQLFVLFAAIIPAKDLFAGMPPEYDAVYQLNKFGLHIAESHSALKRNDDGSWSYHSQTDTTGIVSIFRKDRIIEQARLEEINGNLRSVRYEYQHKGSKKNRDESIQFHWDSMSANTVVSGKQVTLQLKPQTLDNASLQLKLMMDLQTGKRPLAYHVISKGELDDLRFEMLGNEIIKTPVGDFQTIQIKRARKNNKRTTMMWMAPALHYLPVKIMHIEADGSKFELVLMHVRGKISENLTTQQTSVD